MQKPTQHGKAIIPPLKKNGLCLTLDWIYLPLGQTIWQDDSFDQPYQIKKQKEKDSRAHISECFW